MYLQIPSHFNPCNHADVRIDWYNGLFRVVFDAMASPCTVLIELKKNDFERAKQIAYLAAIECWRIEYKYSRYQKDNFFCHLHAKPNEWVKLDDESKRLLHFADAAWHISEGLFDISSGILRQAWSFKEGASIPPQTHIDELLPHIGWQNIQLDPIKGIKLPPRMELDFGGIGKEYAVDCVLQRIDHAYKNVSCLVNFGGDIATNKPRRNQQPWHVGLESPFNNESQATISLKQGALATSGDSQRYLMHEGKRYSHVLNPKTGWPVVDAPRSVTLAAPTCIQAGFMASLTLLQGRKAKSFANKTGFKFWVYD